MPSRCDDCGEETVIRFYKHGRFICPDCRADLRAAA